MTEISVAIQAGGQSSRMGRDKSFVVFDGRPLIEHVIAAVTNLSDDLFVVTNRPADYAHLGLPMVSDIFPDHGPLGGIYTAVSHARQRRTLVVACDMPWLNGDLLAYMISLAETAEIVIPRWTTFPEPLHALYHKNCLAPMAAKLEAKRLKITGFFDDVAVRYLDRDEIARFDADGRSFANINTPDDVARPSGAKD